MKNLAFATLIALSTASFAQLDTITLTGSLNELTEPQNAYYIQISTSGDWREIRQYQDGLEEGIRKIYKWSPATKKGAIYEVYTYRAGLRDGDYLQYYSDGHIFCTGQYTAQAESGLWQWYERWGEVTRFYQYQ